MVHRIKPLITKNRWAIVTFINSPNYKNRTKKDCQRAYSKYFNVDS